MIREKLKVILTIALLGAVLGIFPSCQKYNKEPVSKTPQLAGTHWEGTITDTEYEESLPYKIIFFSEAKGEATLPIVKGRWDNRKEDGTVWEVTIPFSYSEGDSYIEFNADMSEYSGDQGCVTAIKHLLHGYWLVKRATEDELSFYRTPGAEVFINLKREL